MFLSVRFYILFVNEHLRAQNFGFVAWTCAAFLGFVSVLESAYMSSLRRLFLVSLDEREGKALRKGQPFI